MKSFLEECNDVITESNLKVSSKKKARRGFFLHYLIILLFLITILFVCLYIKKNTGSI